MRGLIAICGETATGKSELAGAIAQQLRSPILSADSRQVYREFDIGTAKPSAVDRAAVPHYLIDICDPTETLTVAAYQDRAQSTIDRLHRQGQIPLLVGGTGLYIKAVTRGLKIPRVAPLPELRSQLASLSQVQCYSILQHLDPTAAAKIHPNDTVRTLRALEVFYATGCPISQLQGENPPNYPILHIGLTCHETEAITRRIRKRTDRMVKMGFIAEVERLVRKYDPDLPLLDTLGYAEMKRYLTGEIALAEAMELTIVHTCQFAKRQRTWFRRVPDIEWFDADRSDLFETVGRRIQAWQSEKI